jgi:hypothetical protein
MELDERHTLEGVTLGSETREVALRAKLRARGTRDSSQIVGGDGA